MKLCLTLLFSAFLAGLIYAQENWPRFRGVDGRGVSEAKLPEEIGTVSYTHLTLPTKLSV